MRIFKRLFSTQIRQKKHLMEYKFDKDTKLMPNTEISLSYEGHLTENWSISNAPNGGYLSSMAISAARNETNFRDVIALSAFFTTKAVENEPVLIDAQVVSQSKTSSTVSVNLHQNSKLGSTYTCMLGSLSSMKGPTFRDESICKPPELPGVYKCVDATPILRSIPNVPIFNQFDIRLAPDDPCLNGILSADKSNSPKFHDQDEIDQRKAIVSGWMRFSDMRPICLRSLALLSDAMLPPILNKYFTHWVPTLSYNVEFWSRPTSIAKNQGWVKFQFKTAFAINGTIIEEGEIWDGFDDTRLLATSRQVARILLPKTHNITKAD